MNAFTGKTESAKIDKCKSNELNIIKCMNVKMSKQHELHLIKYIWLTMES